MEVILVKLRSGTIIKTPPIGIGYLLRALSSIKEITPVFIDLHRDNISEEKLLKLIKKATIKFYLRPKIFFNVLKRMAHPIFIKSSFTRLVGIFKALKK